MVLLTNRVHPSRKWSDVGELRRAVAGLARISPRAACPPGPMRCRRTSDEPGEPPRRPATPGTHPWRAAVAAPGRRPGGRGDRGRSGRGRRTVDLRPGPPVRHLRGHGDAVLPCLGLERFPELRLELARETAARRPPGTARLPATSAPPTPSSIVAKIALSDARAIEDTGGDPGPGRAARAMDALAGAEHIDIYGVGSSAFVCLDLHQKLHRIGLLASSGRPACRADLRGPAGPRGRGDRHLAYRHD